MSQRRKQQQKKEQKNKLIKYVVSSLAIILVAFFFIASYNNFFQKTRVENFIPNDPLSFLLVNINPDNDQHIKLRDLGHELGDPDYFKNALQGLIIPNINHENFPLSETDIQNWFGEEIGISKLRLSSVESVSSIVISVRNKEHTENFFEQIKTNLQNEGSARSTEDFRGYKIDKLEGQKNLAFSFVEEFLLISDNADGIKKMIDTYLGKNTNLLKKDDYKFAKKKLNREDNFIFAAVDSVEALKLLSTISKSSFDPVTLSQISQSPKKVNLYASFSARDSGIFTNVFFKQDKSKSKIDFLPELYKKLSQDTALFVEGINITNFIESFFVNSNKLLTEEERDAEKTAVRRGIELKYNLNLEEDIYSIINNEYILTTYPGSEERIELGLSFASDNIDQNKISRFEVLIESIVAEYLLEIDEPIKFISGNYKDHEYRYINLPEDKQFDIYLATQDDHLLLASSESTLSRQIDGFKNLDNDLVKDTYNFTNTKKELDLKDSKQLIYSDAQPFLKLLSELKLIDYERLDSKVKQVRSAGFTNVKDKDGLLLNGFFLIK